MIFERDRGIHVLMIPAYEPDQLDTYLAPADFL